MKDETDYYKMIYDRFVKEQKELGIWIEPEKAFDEQKKVLKKNKLFDKKKKPKKELSEEQLLKNKEYVKKVNSNIPFQIPKPIFNKLDYDQAKLQVYNILFNTLSYQMKELVFTERDKIVYRALTQYFNRESEGENKFPKDLYKGICLFGGVGTGKTLTMQVFQQFTRNNTNKFKIFDMKTIARDVQKNGIDVLEEYMRGTCCYEDVGFENPVQHYGSKWDVFEEIVNICYEKGKTFHFTTNLSFNENLGYGTFAERYDRRVVDRLNEMVNVIGLDGDSKRK